MARDRKQAILVVGRLIVESFFQGYTEPYPVHLKAAERIVDALLPQSDPGAEQYGCERLTCEVCGQDQWVPHKLGRFTCRGCVDSAQRRAERAEERLRVVTEAARKAVAEFGHVRGQEAILALRAVLSQESDATA